MVAPQPFYQDRGTPIALRQVLEALSELEYRVDLLTFPVGEDIELPGLTILRTGNPFGIAQVPIGLSFAKILLDVALTSRLRLLLRRASYTCIHALEEAAFPSVVLARRYGIPLLYDMQSSLPEQLLRGRSSRLSLVRGPLEAAERWLLTRSDIVVSSAGLADRVARAAPGTRAREWSYPSLPAAPDPAEIIALRRELGFAPEDRIVLYSGNFEQYQGLPALIAAMPLVSAAAPNARFVLVGGDEADLPVGSEAAGSLLARGVLRIVERRPRRTMGAYYALADVLVSPRAYGGNLPLKVFDYLAAGRAIVATDIPTHRTVLAEDRAVLVEPNSEALAKGILSLLRDPERAARIGRAARHYAHEHLAWKAFVRSVEELYEEVHRHVGSR